MKTFSEKSCSASAFIKKHSILDIMYSCLYIVIWLFSTTSEITCGVTAVKFTT